MIRANEPERSVTNIAAAINIAGMHRSDIKAAIQEAFIKSPRGEIQLSLSDQPLMTLSIKELAHSIHAGCNYSAQVATDQKGKPLVMFFSPREREPIAQRKRL